MKIKTRFKIPDSRLQNGTSLVEVILCMFLLFVLLVFYASALNTVALTRKLRYENIAYHVANKQMETLRSLTYDNLSGAAAIVDPLLAQIPSGAGNYAVANYPGYNNMKEVVVTVTWNDGINKQVVIRTLAGTGGINP